MISKRPKPTMTKLLTNPTMGAALSTLFMSGSTRESNTAANKNGTPTPREKKNRTSAPSVGEPRVPT